VFDLAPRLQQISDSEDAAEQAKRLLIFHMGEGFEDGLGFEPPRQAPSRRNPANPKQKFDVLEVVGYAAPHGEYRMRLTYNSSPRGCILMDKRSLNIPACECSGGKWRKGLCLLHAHTEA
jgi:hypothetical protein